MFKISKLEFKKSRKKYSRKFTSLLVLLIILSALSIYYSAINGVKSDYMLYKIATNEYIDNPRFVVYDCNMDCLRTKQVDLVLQSNYIAISGSDKSFSAADELRSYLRDKYDYYLLEKYGSKAFPVLISVDYLKRETKVVFVAKPKGKVEKKKIEGGSGVEGKVKENQKIQPEILVKEFKELETKLFVKKAYTTPENLSPPSLLEKLIYSFLFVIPSYFTIQVFFIIVD